MNNVFLKHYLWSEIIKSTNTGDDDQVDDDDDDDDDDDNDYDSTHRPGHDIVTRAPYRKYGQIFVKSIRTLFDLI